MRAALGAALVVLAVSAAAPPASAATPRVDGSGAFLFVPGDQTIVAGDSLTLVNADPAAHDVTSLDDGPVGGHLFRSIVLDQPGQRAPVVGVAALEAGTYEFYCSVHPEMRGTVTVA
jgi:plastocyanin